MNKHIKLFPLVLLLCLLYAFNNKENPTPEQPTTIAYYQFYHIKDTTQKAKVFSEDFILAFNTEKSLYTSQTRLKQDSTIQAALKQAETKNNDVIDMGVILPATEDDIYVDKGKLSVVKNHYQQSYLINESTAKTNWTIEKDTKQLLGYTAQMATATVKGRKYTAWFTTDIAANFGPWKLNGLPGLILEAYDDNYFIKFTCTKVVTTGSFQNITSVNIPTKIISTSLKEYERMKKAEAEGLGTDDFGSGITIDKVTSSGGGNNGTASKKKFTMNYPLELTN
ncbi:GLPGLI family protein [Pedobacter sp. W3I1]|uniref:GLPGLI family protein n=1 Tax=Pedobacter sp. W3I1 TaxID=3042291 RepID=UPI0027896157|nr:GLPGLI family protein [Pedobacter sp. W3I1]MDQ0637423.1 GLPGLI family protein [Pedobacter sp. W3I1]